MKPKRSALVAGVAVTAAVVAGLAGGVSAERGGHRDGGGRETGDRGGGDRGRPGREREGCELGRGQQVDISEAKLIIEYNATDGDLGVHGLFDDSGWSALCVVDPEGDEILEVEPDGRLEDLTMGSLFFESREPPIDELGFPELAERFPEGGYEVRARSLDGSLLVGTATFTHDVPAEPVISSPDVTDDEEAAGEVVVPASGLVVGWEPVTGTVAGDPVELTGYEVILTKIDHEDPNGFSRPIYDVHLGPDAGSLPVPDEFVEPGTAYELEVLALEVSGNQTIGLGFFTTEG